MLLVLLVSKEEALFLDLHEQDPLHSAAHSFIPSAECATIFPKRPRLPSRDGSTRRTFAPLLFLVKLPRDARGGAARSTAARIARELYEKKQGGESSPRGAVPRRQARPFGEDRGAFRGGNERVCSRVQRVLFVEV